MIEYAELCQDLILGDLAPEKKIRIQLVNDPQIYCIIETSSNPNYELTSSTFWKDLSRLDKPV